MRYVRICFLDVDGVLNNNHTKDMYDAWGTGNPNMLGLDEVNIREFQAIQEELKLTIVWSSTWRTHPRSVDYLKYRGLWVNVHPDWRTPEMQLRHMGGSLKDYRIRGQEIEAWLCKHSEIDPNTGYVIIDDIPQFLDYQNPRFVWTDPEQGFSFYHAHQVRLLFGGK